MAETVAASIARERWRRRGNNRQLPAQIREQLREAQDLRREWGASGIGAGRLDEVIEELKRLADGKMEGDAATAALLKADVVEPLRQLELELSRQVQQQSGRTICGYVMKAPRLRSIDARLKSTIEIIRRTRQ